MEDTGHRKDTDCTDLRLPSDSAAVVVCSALMSIGLLMVGNVDECMRCRYVCFQEDRLIV